MSTLQESSTVAPVSTRTMLAPIASESSHRSKGLWRWGRRAAALLVLAGLAVVLKLTYFAPVLVPVTVVRVATGSVEELVANNRAGSVVARRRAGLSPEIGGRIVSLPVQDGDRVRRGDVLLVLADADVRAQVLLQERALDAARAGEIEACANADLAARELTRMRQLLADGFASQQAVDQLDNQRTTAAAACTAAHSRIGQAAAAVAAARVGLDKTVLRAPFDAVVSRVTAHLGEVISPSPAGLALPTALELVDTHSIYVRAPIDEVDAHKLRVGLAVRITMDAFPGRSFTGCVSRVGAYVSEVQQQNRTFDIDVAFDDDALAQTLLPGTSADVEVVLQSRAGVTRLPTSAILQGGRVLVVRDGLLAAVSIQAGLANWDYTEIRSGVAPGDRVVTSLDRPEVREGARVRVTSEGGS